MNHVRPVPVARHLFFLLFYPFVLTVAHINNEQLDIDLPNAKLAYTIIQSLLQANESLSDLLVVMAHALDEDVTKALTMTGEWQKYLESKRELEVTKEQIELFTAKLKELGG